MAWVDDRIWCHPKIVGVSKGARWAFVSGLAYSAGFQTRGHLSEAQIRALGVTARERQELTGAGLWEQNGDGVIVHDWDDHNARRDRERAANRERKRRQRERDNAVTSRVTSGVTSTVTAHCEGSEGSEELKTLTTSSASVRTADVQDIYDLWRQERGKRDRRYDRISQGRKTKILARLKEFSADDLKRAIRGVALDPWDERPRHDDLTVIFRSREQVERFLEFDAPSRPQGHHDPELALALKAARAAAADQARRGA